jgi:glycogen operon protein
VTWHGVRLGEPPWRDPQSPVLACTLGALAEVEEDLHLVFNMSEQAADVALPEIPGRRWHLAVDTSLPAPDEIVAPSRQRAWSPHVYPVRPRSVVVLEARA